MLLTQSLGSLAEVSLLPPSTKNSVLLSMHKDTNSLASNGKSATFSIAIVLALSLCSANLVLALGAPSIAAV